MGQLLRVKIPFVMAPSKKGAPKRRYGLGMIVEATDEAVKGREVFFEPVEEATARPGDLRAARRAGPRGEQASKESISRKRPAKAAKKAAKKAAGKPKG